MFEDCQGDELSRRVNLKAKSKGRQLLAGLAFVGLVARATLIDPVLGPEGFRGNGRKQAKREDINRKEAEGLDSSHRDRVSLPTAARRPCEERGQAVLWRLDLKCRNTCTPNLRILK